MDGYGEAPSSSPRYPLLYIQSAVADVASNSGSGLRRGNNNNNLMDKGETWEIRNETNHLSPYSPLIQGRRIELIVQTINRTRYLLLYRDHQNNIRGSSVSIPVVIIRPLIRSPITIFCDYVSNPFQSILPVCGRPGLAPSKIIATALLGNF